MKKLFLTSALFALIIYASGQYNTQLIDPGKTWSIADQPCEGCGGILYSFYIKLQDDTTINAINYTKIYLALDEFMEEWELYGFIRQDGYRYYLRDLPGEEGLAYDFSVNIGDTVEINNPYGAIPVASIVTDIDSVFIEPGNELRKRISLYEYQYYFNTEYWIEGIGSSAGLTVSGMDMTLLTGGDDYTLLCYYEEDEMLFKSTLYSLCYYPLVDIPVINQGEHDFSLFPNPVIDISHLVIRNPENKNYLITINNIYGQNLQKYVIATSEKIEINSREFRGGIYFYSVCEGDELICYGKFLIKH